MKSHRATLWFALSTALGLVLAACSSLRPVVEDVRFYVLRPVSQTETGGEAGGSKVALGIAPVDVPGYLRNKRIAVRHGGSEIRYSEEYQWAERIDKNIQRVLAANFASLLGSTNILLTAWRRNDVDAEIHVSIERFETDAKGEVQLEAQWRITSPGSDITWQTGAARVSAAGSALHVNADEAVTAMSKALADLSREIAESLKRSVPARNGAHQSGTM